MANSLTAGNPEYRSKRMQMQLRKNLVSKAIASFEERPNLVNGDTVHRPYFSRAKVRDYTKGTDTTPQDRTITDEYLSVDQTKEITTYIDNIDEIQNKYNLVNSLVDDDSYQLQKEMDGRFLREIINSTYSMTEWDIGWTSGTAITLSTSNVARVFSKARALMRENDVESSAPWNVVCTPSVISNMELSMVSNGFQKADQTLANGYKGDFMWFRVFESNNVCHKIVLTYTNQPSNSETIVINGITFTAVSSIGTTAWNFLIETDANTTYSYLVAAINNSATGLGTKHYALATASRDTLNDSGVYAVQNTTAGTVTIYSYGEITITEWLSNATKGTTTALLYAAKQWSTDMVIQSDVKVQMNKAPLKLGYNYITYDLYGLKTFTEWANRMLRIEVVAD